MSVVWWRVLYDGFSPPSFLSGSAACGLDGIGKISKDMRIGAMPRIDARQS